MNPFDFIYKNYFADNVFGLFRNLAMYWRENNLFDRALSQKDAFAAFFNAFKYLPDGRILQDLLSEDFYLHEGKRLNLE